MAEHDMSPNDDTPRTLENSSIHTSSDDEDPEVKYPIIKNGKVYKYRIKIGNPDMFEPQGGGHGFIAHTATESNQDVEMTESDDASHLPASEQDQTASMDIHPNSDRIESILNDLSDDTKSLVPWLGDERLARYRFGFGNYVVDDEELEDDYHFANTDQLEPGITPLRGWTYPKEEDQSLWKAHSFDPADTVWSDYRGKIYEVCPPRGDELGMVRLSDGSLIYATKLTIHPVSDTTPKTYQPIYAEKSLPRFYPAEIEYDVPHLKDTEKGIMVSTVAKIIDRAIICSSLEKHESTDEVVHTFRFQNIGSRRLPKVVKAFELGLPFDALTVREKQTEVGVWDSASGTYGAKVVWRGKWTDEKPSMAIMEHFVGGNRSQEDILEECNRILREGGELPPGNVVEVRSQRIVTQVDGETGSTSTPYRFGYGFLDRVEKQKARLNEYRDNDDEELRLAWLPTAHGW